VYRGKRRASAVLAIVAAVAVIGGAAGCSSSSSSNAQSAPPPARMEQVGNNPVPSVVLTQAGARRIGVQTSPVAAAQKGNPMTSIPYAALLYEPDGTTAVYVNTAPLAYTRYFVQVATIAGNQVYISKGLTPGMNVVTVGAEELLGVQNGVGVET
jgi:hypothetical protein